MVEFRILGFKVSRMSKEETIRALSSCKELEARLVKRLRSFEGEPIEIVQEDAKSEDKPHKELEDR